MISIRFIKAQFSSLISTGVDFALTFLLTQFAGCWYVLSTAVGTTAGGYTNFLLGRHWVFKATEQNKYYQLFKYLNFWIVYILLNVSGVYLLTEFFHLNYLFSKIIVAAIMGVFVSYYLQKRFVFRR